MPIDRWWIILAFLSSLPATTVGGERRDATSEDAETFFELKIRPVLAANCVKCHGASRASGGLRLDSRASLLKGGDSGPAIIPGDPAGSLLVKAIGHEDEDLKMPPKKPLAKPLRADLAAWIAAGATWPKTTVAAQPIEGRAHWAFEPLKDIVPPPDPSGWAEMPIDRLIVASQREHGVSPVAPADRRALIRRASIDLTGLLPEPARVDAFVADDRPDALARLVDELLASPAYGERWGRFWLDLARYADTAGDNSDYPIPEAYLYRDYVIDAFNADIPYDRFLHEQLAGDILAGQGPRDDYARRVIATGFIAQAKRFGTNKLEDMHQIIEDTLNTTGQAVLGLSLRCARCHDHKYDPVSTREYYSLYGFFASTQYPFAGSEELRTPSEFAPLVPPDEARAAEAQHAAALARLKSEVAEKEKMRKGGAPNEPLNAELEKLRKELARREKEPALTGVPLAYAVREGKPTDARVQKGGDPHRLGEMVPRGVLGCLDSKAGLAIAANSSGRLELARWLTEGPARALTARVMVNRIWQHHFGKPIVPTPSDFGLRGTPPTHPELLEWLAGRFLGLGWSIKAMHREIMLSRTYQLACTSEPRNAREDTGNVWYWRFDRRPLDAEALRDAMLQVAGNLDRSRSGPHPFPPPSKWTFTAHHQFKAVYPSSRRSVYLMVQRLQPHPYLALFNGPDTNLSTAVRDQATMPMQSLFLMNSPFVHEQADRFARSLIETESSPSERLRIAYLRAFSRIPTNEEQARWEAYLEGYARSLHEEGQAPADREREVWSSVARMLMASNEFFYTD
jgi:hypothetical protein